MEEVLPELAHIGKAPRCMLVENVAGFEVRTLCRGGSPESQNYVEIG